MISSVSENNQVQRFSAVNAFKTTASQLKSKQENEENIAEDTSHKAAPKNILEKIDVNELRECAKYVGEFNISDDDIKYGLMYGRSVIAEYLA